MRIQPRGLFSVHSLATGVLLAAGIACGDGDDGASGSEDDTVAAADMNAATSMDAEEASTQADQGGPGEGAEVDPTPDSDGTASAPSSGDTPVDSGESTTPQGSASEADTEQAETETGAPAASGSAGDEAEPADPLADTGEDGDEAEAMGMPMPPEDGAGADPTDVSDQPASDAPASDVEPDPSAGCSASASAPDGPQTITVDGVERTYIVSLPEGYDPELAYPVIFAYHGLGGSAELVMNAFYFGIEQTGGRPSIFVYPDGLATDQGGAGWPNTDGRDVAFFDAMLSTLQENYCVDAARVFSTGHSYGGMMSHTLGCERAEVLRAIAPVAGAFFGRGGCSGPVAAWGAHGDPDNTVAYESGLSAIERVMEANGCDPASGTKVEPTDMCTLYDCDAGYPVTWCIHDEDHDWPNFAAESIKAFFDSF